MALSTSVAARLLALPEWRLRALAAVEALESGEVGWDGRQLRRIALRLLVIGSREQQQAARELLDVLREASRRQPLSLGDRRELRQAGQNFRPAAA